MGLDMYLEGRKYLWSDFDNPHNDLIKDGYRVKGMTLEVGYWRKHPNLHGYIVDTFAGGVDECQDIELSSEDITKTIEAIKSRNLPHTEGFFFGRSSMDDAEMQEDIAILSRALTWLDTPEKGASRSIVYRASW